MRKAHLTIPFLLCLFFLSSWTIAQKPKTVLVIPFERFEMHSEIKLDVINKVNGVEGDKFYEGLIQSISEAFRINSNDRVIYKVIGEDDWARIRPKMDYGIDGSNSHYACFIDSVNLSDLQDILKDNYCDYFLTLNSCRIAQTKTSFKKDKKKKVVLYSAQYIDYDLFTPLGSLIESGSNYEIEVKATPENYETQGLLLSDLRLEYPKLVNHITNQWLVED